MSESNRVLVERILRGDREAVATWLVDLCGDDVAYLSRFYKFADLPGELCITMTRNNFKTLRSWKGDASLRHWTRVVAINLCLQNLRTERRQMLLTASKYDPEGRKPSDRPCESGADDVLDLPSTQEAFEQAMKALTARERTVIHMHYFLGVPLSGIAEHLGESSANIHQIHKRAKDKLRRNWTPQ
jgi:RNA polymerase sigma factor (sigma-70 family)